VQTYFLVLYLAPSWWATPVWKPEAEPTRGCGAHFITSVSEGSLYHFEQSRNFNKDSNFAFRAQGGVVKELAFLRARGVLREGGRNADADLRPG
jgi:hypothetical protein